MAAQPQNDQTGPTTKKRGSNLCFSPSVMLATPSNPAARALRSAGLIGSDKDTVMRDVSSRDRQGGRKGPTRSRHRSTRPASLAIKGASAFVPTPPVTRARRNAVSTTDAPPASRLPIRTAPPVTQKGSVAGAVANWKEVVESRWDPTTRFLNLENLIESPLVSKYRLPVPGSGGGTARDAAAIFKLASQLKPDVQTLSLANNGLTGIHLMYLSRYLPKLLNLSLANNKLRTWKDIEPLCTTSKGRHRLANLRELELLGNPIVTSMPPEKYREGMARRQTTLAVLDKTPLSAQVTFDAPTTSLAPSDVTAIKPTSTTFPSPMGPSFIDGVVDPSLLGSFLARYFSLPAGCDEIAQAYLPNALFSFQANTNIPIRARIQGLHTSPSLPNQSKLSWSEWHAKGSRNLVRVSAPERIVKSLHSGPVDICSALAALPPMRVNMSDGKSCLDAFMPSGSPGLMVTVHGEFVEGGSEGVRSFDRTFMLCPGPSLGSGANPWPFSILSDQLTIRAYSDPVVWKAGEMTVLPPKHHQSKGKPQPQASTPAQITIEQIPFDQRASLNGFSPEDIQFLLQFINKTRLSVPAALDCLRTNGGNAEEAFKAFERVKPDLPPSAFLQL